jgi:hypothetical protein
VWGDVAWGAPAEDEWGEVDIYTGEVGAAETLDFLAERLGDFPWRIEQHQINGIGDLREGPNGVFRGRAINRLLLPQDVPLQVDSVGGIYGGPSSALVQRRINQLNGFELVNSAYIYTPQGGPGTIDKPFLQDNFLIDLGSGQQSLWANRILADTSETQGYGLWINGMPSRTIYLQRRTEPYYFTYRLPSQNPLFVPPSTGTLSPTQGFYFSSDPVGGNASNTINGGVQPLIFPSTANILYPGNMQYLRVDDAFPDILFYQSLAGPFQGGKVIILGKNGCEPC